MQKWVSNGRNKSSWLHFQKLWCLLCSAVATHLKPSIRPFPPQYGRRTHPHLFTLWSMMPLYPWSTGGWGLATLTEASVGRRSCSCCRMRVSLASLEALLKLPLYTRNKLAHRRSTRSTAAPWRWHRDTSRCGQISPLEPDWVQAAPTGFTTGERQPALTPHHHHHHHHPQLKPQLPVIHVTCDQNLKKNPKTAVIDLI